MRIKAGLFGLFAALAVVPSLVAVTSVATPAASATRVSTNATGTPGPREWSGSVTCAVDVDYSSYSRHESQTWTLTGDAPTMQGSGMTLYPAKWHYTGHGFSRKSGGTIREWSIEASKDVRIAIFVRASDQQLTFHQWDAIAVIPGAITGTLQLTTNNQPATSFTYAAEQWNFNWVTANPTAVDVTGNSVVNPDLPGVLLPDYHANTSFPRATCTWHFTRVSQLTVPESQPGQSVVAGTSSPPVTTTSPLAPAITGVNPSSGPQWSDALVVTFDAKNTHFVQGTTKVDLGAGVTPVAIPPYQAVDIASPTKALINARIAGDAAPGPRNITITTGSEVVKLANGFTVTARDVKEVFTASPDTGAPGAKNMSVTITRPTGNWSQYFYAGTQLDFGPGIIVSSVEVQGGSQVRAMLTISPNATAGPRAVTVKRPTFADETFAAAFTVLAAPVAPGAPQRPTTTTTTPMSPVALSAINPSSAVQGAQNLTLTLTGSFPAESVRLMLFNLGTGVTVVKPLQIASPTTATVQVNIDATAATGPRDVGLASSTTLSNGFTITPKPDGNGKTQATATVANVYTAYYSQFSTTLKGTLHEAGVKEWFQVGFQAGWDLEATLSCDGTGPGGSDFEMVAVNGDNPPNAITTTHGGSDPKKLVFPDSGPHTIYLCVGATTWNIARPNFILTVALGGKAYTPPVTTVEPISFTPVHSAVPGVDTFSNPVVIRGPTVPVPVTIDYWLGSYSINGGPYTTADGTVKAGDLVQLKCQLNLLETSRKVSFGVGQQRVIWEVSTAYDVK